MPEHEYTDEQLEAVRREMPPGLIEAFIDRDRKGRQAEYDSRRRSRVEGVFSRKARPVAIADDRRLVPGALRHWRRVHGLSQRQAQERIGYSARSQTWRKWESGFAAPPYRALLRILAATGLGYWTDPEELVSVDGELRLEMAAAREAHRLAKD